MYIYVCRQTCMTLYVCKYTCMYVGRHIYMYVLHRGGGGFGSTSYICTFEGCGGWTSTAYTLTFGGRVVEGSTPSLTPYKLSFGDNQVGEVCMLHECIHLGMYIGRHT